MVAEGVDIVDVGGESSRPGASPVAEDEELAGWCGGRSPGTGGAGVGRHGEAERRRRAVAAGPPSSTTWPDPLAGRRRTRRGLGGHAPPGQRGRHAASPRYDDVVAQVHAALLAMAAGQGRRASRRSGSTGIGFGKTVEHNLSLLAHVAELADAAHTLGHTVLIGTSRKRFLGALGERPSRSRTGWRQPGDRHFALVHGRTWCGSTMWPERAGGLAGGREAAA